MKILRVAQDVYPETIGGLPYHIHALSRDQAAEGHDVTLLTLSEEVDAPTTENRSGYRVVRYRPTVDFLGNQLSSAVVRHIRRSDEYDIVHAHSHLYFLSGISAALRYVSDTPLAVTCHGLTTQTLPEWFSKLHLHTVGRFTYDAADVTFCYTDVERQRLRKLGVRNNVQVVSNGVDSQRFTPDGETHEAFAGASGPSVLFVGRLVPGKCPDLVVEAFGRLQRSHPDARLYLCGDGALREQLERQVEQLGIGDRVEFLGYVPYESMPAIFRSADVLALPSRTEGFPRTVMEALACETPVVTSPLEQMRSLVERSGRMVANVDQLTAALGELLSDEDERVRLGAAGRRAVRSEHDWSVTVERMTDAMQTTITGVSPEPPHSAPLRS